MSASSKPERALKICFAASEATPFAKTGGLADVAGALPARLVRAGHDVRVFVPFYGQIDRKAHQHHPVDFARDVEVELGSRRLRYSVFVARLPATEASVYLIDCPELFHRSALYTTDADEPERFALFTRAVVESCQRMGWAPEVFHCNDWHTSLLPLLLRTVFEWDSLFRNSRTLMTIHNLGYQGVFPRDAVERIGMGAWSHLFDQQDLSAGRVNFLKTGLIYADVVSTVSPTYAAEIQTADYGMGLQELLRARKSTLVGILNGVDYDVWSPELDPHIPFKYSVSELDNKSKNKDYLLDKLRLAPTTDAPLIGVVSRLVHHKGFDLCMEVLPDLVEKHDLRLVVLGSGEARIETFFEELHRAFASRVCFHRGYHNELAHVIEAASDMILMPSRYEPCGLNQMFGLRYGTIPIVRRTGGLADSVRPVDGTGGEGTGFVFDHFTTEGLRWALESALALFADRKAWRRVVANAMKQDFSWERQAGRYVELYDWMAPSSRD